MVSDLFKGVASDSRAFSSPAGSKSKYHSCHFNKSSNAAWNGANETNDMSDTLDGELYFFLNKVSFECLLQSVLLDGFGNV